MGHLPDNKVDLAYDKSLMLEERKVFLEKWCDLLEKNGLEVWYYENGQKQSEVVYENNKMISKKLRWDARGKPIIY